MFGHYLCQLSIRFTILRPEGAVPEKDSLYWCGGCAKIVKKCNNDSHDTYGLSTALGREMVESHLKTNELTCRLQWETSLGKHEEVILTVNKLFEHVSTSD